MRLIDADAFKAKGRELYGQAGWDLREVHYSQIDTECNIDYMPTIEVEPTKHGRWVDDETAYICSVCFHGSPNGAKWNYCPYCGSRMDLDEVEE